MPGTPVPYGEGITYWPIGELVRSACEITDGDSRETASSKLDACLDGTARAAEIAAGIAAAIGLSDATPSCEEIFWAIRRFPEHLARARPLILVTHEDRRAARPG